MTRKDETLYLVQRYIMSLSTDDQSVVARHIRQVRQIIADSPNTQLAYVAFALVSAERLAATAETSHLRPNEIH